MSQWKNDDSAANSVLWGPSQLKQTANAANRNALFGNTSADAYFTGATIGSYGVDDAEMAYDTFKIIGVVAGANAGVDVLITSNGTTQFIANGTGTVNAVVNVDSVIISSAAINAAGSGYVSGDIVEVAEGAGTPAARLTVTANATGNVTDVAILWRGNYADSANVPAGDVATTNVTGIGTGLVLDISTGVGVMSMADVGSYTVDPGSTLTLTAEAGQTGTNVQVNTTVSKFGAKQAVPHAGHVIVTEGTGGRAGRVQAEVLVAVSSMTGDAEDVKFPNT